MFCYSTEPNRRLLAVFLAFFLITSVSWGAQKRRNTLGAKKATSTKVQPKKAVSPAAASTPVKSTPAAAPAAQAAKVEEPAKPAGTPLAGKIESTTRNVEVKNGGKVEWQKAKTQMSLSTADQIRTGSRSVARVKLGDGSKVLLLQNSQAEMENLSSVQKTIKLMRGRVRAIVAKIKGGNNFQVKTPVGVASVRGTDFEVEISEDGNQMEVEVKEGQVGVSKLGDMSGEVTLNAGEKINFGAEGEIGRPVQSGAITPDREEVRNETQIARSKEAIIAMAAEESRNADYQVGKSLIDVRGQRVRVEEYIMRPAANQFKLVVLNERPEHFDYFTYKGTFNKDLPEDLSIALAQTGGRLGTTAPDYYLTNYETLLSNTIDAITDSASGGHLVKIEFDGTQYTLTDSLDNSHTRTIAAAELQLDGSYKIYNPVRDAFSLVSAADMSQAIKISVLDTVTGDYHNLENGDTFWKTRFDNYSSFINSTAKTAYAVKSSAVRTLAVDLDADFTNSPITAISEFPSGSGSLHNRLSLYYADGSKTTYDNYIIDDEGNIAPTSAFDGKASSAAYKEELEKWNYQQRVTSDEMGGRYIDLVVDPRIGTVSGLIQ